MIFNCKSIKYFKNTYYKNIYGIKLKLINEIDSMYFN